MLWSDEVGRMEEEERVREAVSRVGDAFELDGVGWMGGGKAGGEVKLGRLVLDSPPDWFVFLCRLFLYIGCEWCGDITI